jgi:hypothetical protein
VKAGERYKVRVADASDANIFGGYNLNTGALIDEGVNSIGKTTITELANGWYKLTLLSNQATVARYACISLLQDSYTAGDSLSYVGDGTSGIYIWGAQLEELSYATSYIPTSGVIATRLADSVSGAGDVNTFNSTEGVLYVETAAIGDTGVFEVISLSDGSADNIVAVLYRNTTNDFTAVVKSGGTTSMIKTIALADATDFIKVAVSYKLNEFKLYVNGVLELTDTSGNTPIGLNTLQLTDGNGTSNKFKGKVKDLRVYNTALTDAELIELTTI